MLGPMIEMPVLGEPLAVELANTIVRGGDGEAYDLLRTESELGRWLSAHGNGLPDGAVDAPPSLARVRRLRSAVRELFSAALDGRAPDAYALHVVNTASKAAPARPVLVWPSPATPRVVDATVPGRTPKATLAAVARSAIELLGGPAAANLRRCERRGCVLLFVAANARRRWCSPDICGNRVRVARHYQRHRRPGESSGP